MLDPDDNIVWNNLGIVGGGEVAGDNYNIKQCCCEALRLDPEYSTAWYIWASWEAGRWPGRTIARSSATTRR